MKKIILMAAALIMALSMQAMAASGESEMIIWQEEFDTLDEAKWKISSANKRATIEDGWLVMDTIDSENPNRIFGDKENGNNVSVKNVDGAIDIDISNYSKVETEFKVEFLETSVPVGYGDSTISSWSFPRFSGVNEAGEMKGWVQSAYFYGRFVPYFGANDTKQLYPKVYHQMPMNQIMLLRATYDLVNNTVVWTVYTEDSETPLAELAGVCDGGIARISESEIQLPGNWKARIDYIRIKALGLNVSEIKTSDGKELGTNMRTDEGIDVQFTTAITEDSFKEITVADDKGELVELEVKADSADPSVYHIYFPAGLKYNSNYTLNLGDGIINEQGENLTAVTKEFSTEASPFRIIRVVPGTKFDGVNTTQVRTQNTSGLPRTYEIIFVCYNAENEVVKISHQSVTAGIGTYIASLRNDLTGTGTASIEIYYWDTFEGMHKIFE